MKRYKIYKLINPINDEIFYIGSTCKDLKDRLIGHCCAKKQRGKYIYISKIIKVGNYPLIEEVDSANSLKEANQLEYFYIKEYINNGHPLLNRYIPHLSKPHNFTMNYQERITNELRDYLTRYSNTIHEFWVELRRMSFISA